MTSATNRQAPGWLLLAGPLTIALAGMLRIGWPTLAEFKFDEARMAALAMELPQAGRLPLAGLPSSAGFEHSPISVYLYMPAFLFTTSVVPAIIYGGLVNVAAVALCWWLARRLSVRGASGWPSLIPAVLMATSPWAIALGRKIWQIAFVIPLALVFLALAIAALVPGTIATESRARNWPLAGSLVALALLIQVHPSAILLVPALGFWLILFRHQVRLWPVLIGAGLGLATALPFLIHQVRTDWPVLAATQSLGQPRWDGTAIHLAWDAITGRGFHILGGAAYPWLAILNLIGWATVAGALLLGWKVLRAWRAADSERRRAAQVDLILLSWLLSPILLSLRHNLDLALHSFALIIPAAYLVIGRALAALVCESRPHGKRPAWVVDALGAGLGLLAASQVLLLALTGRYVAVHRGSEAFGMPLFRYLEISTQALERAAATNAAEIVVVGEGDSIGVDETPAIFDTLLRGKLACRFVDGQSAALFPATSTLVLLTPGAHEAGRWYRSWPVQSLGDGYELVELDGSWPTEDLTPVSGPRLFGNGIEVQAYTWRARSSTAEPAGRLWLLWQVLWLSSGDTHFSARLVDGSGQLVGQQDHTGYPTASRRKGDRILSRFDLMDAGSAASGPYWASVGVYLYPQVANLPVIDQAGNELADAVTFGPLSEQP